MRACYRMAISGVSELQSASKMHIESPATFKHNRHICEQVLIDELSLAFLLYGPSKLPLRLDVKRTKTLLSQSALALRTIRDDLLTKVPGYHLVHRAWWLAARLATAYWSDYGDDIFDIFKSITHAIECVHASASVLKLDLSNTSSISPGDFHFLNTKEWLLPLTDDLTPAKFPFLVAVLRWFERSRDTYPIDIDHVELDVLRIKAVSLSRAPPLLPDLVNVIINLEGSNVITSSLVNSPNISPVKGHVATHVPSVLNDLATEQRRAAAAAKSSMTKSKLTLYPTTSRDTAASTSRDMHASTITTAREAKDLYDALSRPTDKYSVTDTQKQRLQAATSRASSSSSSTSAPIMTEEMLRKRQEARDQLDAPLLPPISRPERTVVPIPIPAPSGRPQLISVPTNKTSTQIDIETKMRPLWDAILAIPPSRISSASSEDDKKTYSRLPLRFPTSQAYIDAFQHVYLAETRAAIENAAFENRYAQPRRATLSNMRRDSFFHYIEFELRGADVTQFSEFDLVRVDISNASTGERAQFISIVESMPTRPNSRPQWTARFRAQDAHSYLTSKSASVTFTKIATLMNIVREFRALQSISSLLSSVQRQLLTPSLANQPSFSLRLDPYLKHYNPSQQTAIRSAVSTQGITLIQGPPGTGKTATIIGIISALLSMQSDAVSERGKRRILVCTPSNVAVDEILLRLCCNGIVDESGNKEEVRAGRVVRIVGADVTTVHAGVAHMTLDKVVEEEAGGVQSGNGKKFEASKRQKSEVLARASVICAYE